ncbi:GNAT family N-acetyltransferase [Cellulomonas dongxiuzhuiae]|uniref:GNAT family N-acetyltransferase n=1 Tax=Cellulomonas dongxiuzhuiae TaxID=2819979 RepID=UPI001AB00B3A|nr:GNAT family N-acetyltransferase [Cellulomonas dongxiuzhuiae]MBO3089648.1 N-acetyltransferase [Cellulomonas dongxiuzhuiae]
MTRELMDRTGAPVTVALERAEPVSAYTVSVAGERLGRADFLDVPDAHERVFFHTEVDARFAGRGLAGLLLREALADSVREHLTVVPVCPLFARHLEKHGDDYVAEGGAFRRPGRADLALVRRAVQGPA